MLFSTLSVVLATLAGGALAQRPTNTSICDYYTTALLKDNNATNQLTLLTLLVNTAVIGNYTKPNMNAVPGILNPNATYMGKKVNLIPFFAGSLMSSNVNGAATAVNFLDDGGAVPLTLNKPANGTSSNQYRLLTHLYSFFGAALGCTQYGMTGYPAYAGKASQYEVHKFMDLDASQVGYFIQQVGLSAQSFGVATDDITAVGKLLTTTFDTKCSQPAAVIPAQGPQLQAICIADDCTQAENATCSSYAASPSAPANATGSATATQGAPSSSGTGKSGSGGAVGLSAGTLMGTIAAVGGVAVLAMGM